MPYIKEGGSSLVDAIRTHLPAFTPTTIFDVGANVGQSAIAFATAFPNAAIYSFEPIANTYQELVARTLALPKVRTFRLAFGQTPGQAPMLVNPNSSTASRVSVEAPRPFEHVEMVPMGTGDSFCAAHAITRIGFLKIDTEGHDLDVLMGFANMLTEKRIDLAEAEVSMNRLNTKHIALDRVKGYMESIGYSLFHIYDQTLDVAFSGRPILRRSNVVFISLQLAEHYRRRK